VATSAAIIPANTAWRQGGHVASRARSSAAPFAIKARRACASKVVIIDSSLSNMERDISDFPSWQVKTFHIGK